MAGPRISQKEEGRRKKKEGRRKKGEQRNRNSPHLSFSPSPHLPIGPSQREALPNLV
jgi:hypothetical protein